MGYAVKELFFTLQGEGARSGRAAVFLRFTGCNLWSGREEDRARGTGGCARWCDTDFVGTDGPGGGRFSDPDALARRARATWDHAVRDPRGAVPYVVCTGGEPLLQLDEALVHALHAQGFEVAVETNGTRPVPPGVDWVCVSPKGGAPLAIAGGDELKLVFPQPEEECAPSRFEGLAFAHWFVQPMDGPRREESARACVDFCRAHPRWRLSLQSHKLLGIP
jgi:7-carboxy-7-deazaguanine synthase